MISSSKVESKRPEITSKPEVSIKDFWILNFVIMRRPHLDIRMMHAAGIVKI